MWKAGGIGVIDHSRCLILTWETLPLHLMALRHCVRCCLEWTAVCHRWVEICWLWASGNFQLLHLLSDVDKVNICPSNCNFQPSSKVDFISSKREVISKKIHLPRASISVDALYFFFLEDFCLGFALFPTGSILSCSCGLPCWAFGADFSFRIDFVRLVPTRFLPLKFTSSDLFDSIDNR